MKNKISEIAVEWTNGPIKIIVFRQHPFYSDMLFRKEYRAKNVDLERIACVLEHRNTLEHRKVSMSVHSIIYYRISNEN